MQKITFDEAFCLSEQEIISLTGYKRPSRQLATLQSLGVPALMRPGNSVLVLRMHLEHPVSGPAGIPMPRPMLKSSAKKLLQSGQALNTGSIPARK